MASQVVRNAAMQLPLTYPAAAKSSTGVSRATAVPHCCRLPETVQKLQRGQKSFLGNASAGANLGARGVPRRVPASLRVSVRASQGIIKSTGQTNELIVREVQQPQSRVSLSGCQNAFTVALDTSSIVGESDQ